MSKNLQQAREEKIAFWQPYIIDWRRSGKSVKAYCQEKNLRVSQFKYWQYEIAPETKRPIRTLSSHDFLTVTSTPSAPKEKIEATGQATCYEIVFPNEMKLIIQESVNESTLKTLLNTLRELA